MSEIDYTREETIDVALFFPQNPLTQGANGIMPILKAIDAYAGGLYPDQIVGRAVMPYSHKTFRRLIVQQKSRSKIVLDLVRSTDPEVLYEMSFVQDGPIGFWLRIIIPFSYFAEIRWAEERSQELVALVLELARACPPAYGYAHSKGDLALGCDPHTADPFATNAVYEAYWLNLYGTEMVQLLGRERVLSTPAAEIEEIPSGGILLLTQSTPADYASEDARVAQARALAHLREDVAFEEALARLRQRSAKLAPVEKNWDIDIADLLELTLDSVSYAERQQEIARLNQYHPPEVSEWMPLSDLLPVDVGDPEEIIALYGGLYAERLAALLHNEVPAVMGGTPESLPPIDYHFWHFDYPGTFKREDIDNDLVPAIGAYLGEVMVNHLGGRWIPRRNIDESQVVIGERAWLPFLRARHYMQSKQSALDYSLTQFYRVAVRTARSKVTR
jgi:hypothetical protein